MLYEVITIPGERKHHDAHDTLAVGFFAVSAQCDLTAEICGQSDKAGSSAGVHAAPIYDGDYLTFHLPSGRDS